MGLLCGADKRTGGIGRLAGGIRRAVLLCEVVRGIAAGIAVCGSPAAVGRSSSLSAFVCPATAVALADG